MLAALQVGWILWKGCPRFQHEDADKLLEMLLATLLDPGIMCELRGQSKGLVRHPSARIDRSRLINDDNRPSLLRLPAVM